MGMALCLMPGNTMVEKRWKACFYSVMSVSPYLLFLAIGITIHDKADFLQILGSTLMIGLPAYLFISFMGWMFVGMPLCWAIEKYTGAGLQQYVAVSLLPCAVVGLFGVFSVLTFGIPIVLQSAGFWFYMRKYAAA